MEGPPPQAKSESALIGPEREALAELEAPIAKILARLRPKIERGEYGLIIGDDASGRIPALIIRDVIKAVYNERGYTLPEVRFISGSSELEDGLGDKKELVRKYIADVQESMREDTDALRTRRKRSALVVTDTINRGTSVSVLVHALRAAGIPAEIATVGLIENNWFSRLQTELRTRAPITAGMTGTPSIYGKGKALGGVWKNTEEVFSHATTRTAQGPDAIQRSINETRTIIHTMSDKLAAPLLSK